MTTATTETESPTTDTINGTVDGAEATIKLTPPEASTPNETAAADHPDASATTTPAEAEPKTPRAEDVQLRLVEPHLEDLVRAYGEASVEEEEADDRLTSAKARLKFATSRRESIGKEIARAALRMRNPSLADVARGVVREAEARANAAAATPAKGFDKSGDRYVLSGMDGTVIGGGRFMRVPQEANKDLCMCGAAMDVGGDVHDSVHGAWLEAQEKPATEAAEEYPRIPSEADPSHCTCGAFIDADRDYHQRKHAAFVATIGHELAPSTIPADKAAGDVDAAADGDAT